MTDVTVDFEAGLAEDVRRVAEADARLAAAGSAEERDAARAEALVARRALIRARAIDLLLGRGRLIPGLALVERLDCWLREQDLDADALDALARAFNRRVEE